jgi:hypothetical protein
VGGRGVCGALLAAQVKFKHLNSLNLLKFIGSPAQTIRIVEEALLFGTRMGQNGETYE